MNYATFAQVDKLGFLKTPYYKVNNGVIDYEDLRYLTASEEIGYSFAQSSVEVDESNRIVSPSFNYKKRLQLFNWFTWGCWFSRSFFKTNGIITAAGIPFLENDDANRALMGSSATPSCSVNRNWSTFNSPQESKVILLDIHHII
ncbi:hypothetical protein NW064_01880 [Mycoplasmopsis felis]|uniref:hypothetical protein n=1 Tax=Mycoplasmopsis felis TaxID=33923 RepID=UPI0021AF1580|nr:hypothetical protein [Mycoplasmopsis felis]UWW01148.1 hypothetical protein NW064_01880 [Mycoplasmopsis felis]